MKNKNIKPFICLNILKYFSKNKLLNIVKHSKKFQNFDKLSIYDYNLYYTINGIFKNKKEKKIIHSLYLNYFIENYKKIEIKRIIYYYIEIIDKYFNKIFLFTNKDKKYFEIFYSIK